MSDCTMDYPQAFAFLHSTSAEDHHVRCSWGAGLLCDCGILDAEYERRKRALSTPSDKS